MKRCTIRSLFFDMKRQSVVDKADPFNTLLLAIVRCTASLGS